MGHFTCWCLKIIKFVKILNISWLFMTMLFMLMNMHSIIDKKVHIFLKSNK